MSCCGNGETADVELGSKQQIPRAELRRFGMTKPEMESQFGF